MKFDIASNNFIVGESVGKMYSTCMQVFADELHANSNLSADEIHIAIDDFKNTLRNSSREELKAWYDMAIPSVSKTKPRRSKINANKF